MIVRRLDELDAQAWQSLRLRSLQQAPDAFLSSYEAEKDKPIKTVVDLLRSSITVGAFSSEELIGQMTARAETNPRMKHRVWITAVFVDPAHRGTGAAQRMLDQVVEIAKCHGALQLELHVAEANPRAINFYKRNGFMQLGVVPRAVRGRNGFEDDLYLVRHLDSGESGG